MSKLFLHVELQDSREVDVLESRNQKFGGPHRTQTLANVCANVDLYVFAVTYGFYDALTSSQTSFERHI